MSAILTLEKIDEALAKCDELLRERGHIHGCVKFVQGNNSSPGVKNTLISFKRYIEHYGDLTKKQENALENICKGIDKWIEGGSSW